MELLILIFWFSVALIFYSYFGYPLLLVALCALKRRPVDKGDITPTVSFIVTAFNEEEKIRTKLENTLVQNYPKDKLEIIVASDCSTDKTDEIVKSYQSQGVRLIRTAERKGKENAQKYAVDISTGEILVFSDTATGLQPDGISNIVKNFSDPTVGCVSSVDKFISEDGSISGEGAYVKYEMLLRKLETNFNTLVGLSGSFFAARREVCLNWAVDLQSDFNTLLNSVKIGLRGVSDPDSIGLYKNIIDEKKEYDRKVRTVIRGISVFMKSWPLLNPFKYGLFSWQLLSHKLSRWLVPFAMILAFVTNLLLIRYSALYAWLFAAQLIFYLFAFVGLRSKSFRGKQILKVPSFFLLANMSILNAWYRYLRGQRVVMWNPSKR